MGVSGLPGWPGLPERRRFFVKVVTLDDTVDCPASWCLADFSAVSLRILRIPTGALTQIHFVFHDTFDGCAVVAGFDAFVESSSNGSARNRVNDLYPATL